MQACFDFFQTLHDETSPTGHLGRGTHYSVLRAVVFHDPMGKPLSQSELTDFAVIWDEDHDVRVVEPIEAIYRRGLLSSFLMFGERKGSFTAVLSNEVNPGFCHHVVGPFTERTQNCLTNDDIYFIGDLVQKKEHELLRLPNFGQHSLNEIKEELAKMGLHLGMELRCWSPENRGDLKGRKEFLETEIKAICQSLSDPWPSNVVTLGSPRNPIIDDDEEKVSLYLKNLEMLWQLGT
jgi:hypothetical protein